MTDHSYPASASSSSSEQDATTDQLLFTRYNQYGQYGGATLQPRETDPSDNGIPSGFLIGLIFIVLCLFRGVCMGPPAQVSAVEVASNQGEGLPKPKKKREDPETRRKRILKAFDANQVTLIVTADNITSINKNEPSKSPNAGDEKKIQGGSEISRGENEIANSSRADGEEEGIRLENDDDHPNDELVSPIAPVDTVALKSNSSNFLDVEAGVTMEDDDGFLILPHRVPPHQSAEVPNLCAICLDSYYPGDSVVWSSNPKCCHVFHTDCMVHYLIKVKNGSTPCPTCRQTFTALEVLKDESVINSEEEC